MLHAETYSSFLKYLDSIADPKLLISDPEPTLQVVSDPDPCP